MASEVTITGGTNHGDFGSPSGYDLGLGHGDVANVQAQTLADAINLLYGSQATQVYPNIGAPGGLVIVPEQTQDVVDFSGYNAIAVQNTNGPTKVEGGGVTNQTVVSGLGDLTFYASGGRVPQPGSFTNIDLAAIGGNNQISYQNTNGYTLTTTSTGNDTVLGGNGQNDILLGTGNNSVQAGGAYTNIFIQGNDTTSLGRGYANIHVDQTIVGASDLVHGTGTTDLASTVATLSFFGGSGASTVESGGGRYNITAGSGGGVFSGGFNGGNYMFGTTGSVTLAGGGDGDFLMGSSSSDVLRGGSGDNVTMIGGGGADTFIGGQRTEQIFADGTDLVQLGHGATTVNVSGQSTIQLGSGTAVVDFNSTQSTVSALVQGSTFLGSSSGYSLNFVGGAGASTVLSGLGRYSITAGAGGGVFQGGTAGGNSIIGGDGAVTLFGGGDGDYLRGGDHGNNVIHAGSGSETLQAGAGNTTLVGDAIGKDDFLFKVAGAFTIAGFHTSDVISFGDGGTANYAINHYAVSDGSNGTITLGDGVTKIVLQGYAGLLGTQHGKDIY